MDKVILAPDSFKGTMSSSLVCSLMKKVILRHFPHAEVIEIPIADGGEGTVEAFLATFSHSEKIFVPVKDPYGQEMQAFMGLSDRIAVIEMAACAGLPLTKKNRNPCVTTTYGVGQLIKKALDLECRTVLVGLGGSGTNDGGCGIAAALGVRFLDKDGISFVPVGGTLKDICDIDISRIDTRIASTEIFAVCDIDNPLCGKNGAAYIFGPQKGADAEMVEFLDQGLLHLDKVVARKFGRSFADIPGTAAAGGCGYGLKVFFDAKIKMGIETLLDAVGFDRLLKGADYVFTGEGKIDGQSLRGKVVSGISKRASKAGVPVIAVVGDIGDDAVHAYRHGISAIFSTNRAAIDFSIARTRCQEDIERCMDNIVRFIKTIEQRNC